MSSATREYLGSCDCIAADGTAETVSSYRLRDAAGEVIVHRSQNMLPARWCETTRAFYIDSLSQPFWPTEPVLQVCA